MHFPASVKVKENALLYLFWGLHPADYISCTACLVKSKTHSQSGGTLHGDDVLWRKKVAVYCHFHFVYCQINKPPGSKNIKAYHLNRIVLKTMEPSVLILGLSICTFNHTLLVNDWFTPSVTTQMPMVCCGESHVKVWCWCLSLGLNYFLTRFHAMYQADTSRSCFMPGLHSWKTLKKSKLYKSNTQFWFKAVYFLGFRGLTTSSCMA